MHGWLGRIPARTIVLSDHVGRFVEEHGRVPIIGRTWAHPAFSGQDVFARSDRQLVCVRLAD